MRRLVCVYSTKWRQLEREPGQFNFKRSDRYVDFAERDGMQFRGHTLVWEKDCLQPKLARRLGVHLNFLPRPVRSGLPIAL